MQNAFIESFNGRLRDELLNETLFSSQAQVRIAVVRGRSDYNDLDRTRNSDGKRLLSLPHLDPRRVLTLRHAEGYAQIPVVSAAQQGNSNGEGELKIGKNLGARSIDRNPTLDLPSAQTSGCCVASDMNPISDLPYAQTSSCCVASFLETILQDRVRL
jgi:hypothetical protein